MHQCIKLFYFGMTLYMFQTVFPSMSMSSRLYLQQQAFARQQYVFPYTSVTQNWAGPCILDLLVKYKHNTNFKLLFRYVYHHNHHHKHQVLDPLIRSVSRVTAARANASSVFQLFSFLVVCSGMISKGFGFVAFFANVEASSVCIHLPCLVRL